LAQINSNPSGSAYTIFRIIFYGCSVYFFLMGIGLILFPHFLVRGVGGMDVSPAIIGMLRGSGGAVVPYALLYFLIAKDPVSRRWGLSVIAVANFIAIILDVGSVLMNEYRLSYAMIDLPVEILSLLGILIIRKRLPKVFHTHYL
jgi:hypothetical protein